MEKRMLCLVLALVMGLLGCAAAAEEKTYALAGFDDTQYRTWKDNAFFQRMEEKTGVQFSYQQFKKMDEWTAAKASYVKGGEMPDVLFKAGLTSTECMDMYEKGVLVDLKPYLEANCENLWALLQKYPEVMEAITLPGGQIVALPYIKPTGTQNYLWVNETWLSHVKMDMPTDKESFEQVLRAFRDKDPNRNGKQDEVPLSFLGPFDLKFLAHAYGLAANDYNIFVEEGQVKFLPLEENFRPFLEWCRMLYGEKLLDQQGFYGSSYTRSQIASADEESVTYGMFFAPMAYDVIRNKQAYDYTLMMPLQYEGKQLYRDFSGITLRGTFAVTTACDDVEKMLQWVDQLYTLDGYLLENLGMENVDFYYNKDGTWQLTDSTLANSFFTMSTLITGGATAPGAAFMEFDRLDADKQNAAIVDKQQEFAQYLVSPFPAYTLTQEESREAARMQSQLGPYVDAMMARFIRGDVELNDETYAAFIIELKETYDAEGFVAFWQKILEAH